MQDRFRFRLWNKRYKKMIYNAEDVYDGSLSGFCKNEDNNNDGHISCFGEYLGRDDEYIVMQCTGIEDVKGNLIYEGDILKVVNGSINGIGLSDKWEVKWVGNGWNISQWSFDCTHSYEVISNIYENKELLKEKE